MRGAPRGPNDLAAGEASPAARSFGPLGAPRTLATLSTYTLENNVAGCENLVNLRFHVLNHNFSCQL